MASDYVYPATGDEIVEMIVESHLLIMSTLDGLGIRNAFDAADSIERLPPDPSPAVMEFRRRITAGLRVSDKPNLRVIEGGASGSPEEPDD